ncbi:5'-nucleotidase surE (Nucleoside 5'-monophosphate phosphohydrolase)(survival protein, protein damage control) [Hyphomicrobium sp. GJ21]|uniref:5'/3'-nucleotidase SurE n=1 Tax=Hyphomicrobium sp. GJ21 TaxID=113574 RepID=UPI000622BAF7|nr:5'/3'-nucleotidase SurE [Hyphomicrobium sp. GJ21]CEJ85574.1 5'-nucleotidase surE (Nucleoside 5'-monophosphate phosphohydrolase)(survival protein, protein damage control) [Hyphomicrobium sp. GJ21]
MRILITNDDGIHAKGLEILKAIALGISPDVWTIAPETNQSGTAHSMTLHTPLRLRTIDERTHAVTGTPTDCVIMAVRHILKDQPPELILSGVNHGSNLAEDVTYSGTVAAAMEGALLGIHSIALSQMMGFEDGERRAIWDTSLAHAPQVIKKLLAQTWNPNVLMNVNFPDTAPENVTGIAVTSQGVRDQALLNIDSRSDPWGTPYFWFGFERRLSTLVAGTDLAAIAENKISITPLSVDLTDRDAAEVLAARLG